MNKNPSLSAAEYVKLSISLPPDVHKEAVRKAEAEGRGLSNYIKQAIKRDLRRRNRSRLALSA